MATIDNANYGAVVRGTSNEDSIRNAYAYDVTIQALAGNDKISLGAVGNLIQYASGDGKDSIFGFNESDTLTITGGKYSTQVSGNDVIVKVGKGSIRLVEAKGKTLNINSKKSTDIITLTKNADTLENNLDGVRIKARGGNNSVDNGGDSVTTVAPVFQLIAAQATTSFSTTAQAKTQQSLRAQAMILLAIVVPTSQLAAALAMILLIMGRAVLMYCINTTLATATIILSALTQRRRFPLQVQNIRPKKAMIMSFLQLTRAR